MGYPVCPSIFHTRDDETAGGTCGGETSRCTETSCGETGQIERENEDGASTPGFTFPVCEGTGGAVGNIREEEFENTVVAFSKNGGKDEEPKEPVAVSSRVS